MNISIDANYTNKTHELIRILHTLSAHRSKHSLALANATLLRNDLEDSPARNLLDELLLSASNRQYEIDIVVTETPNGKRQINHLELNDYLCRPAILIVENGTSDRTFIKSIIHTLQDYTLIESLDTAWEIRTAGGCGEIPKIMADEARKFSIQPRICIVHDSDKEYPHHQLNAAHNKIESDARGYGVPSIMLSKREIENYIPNSTLKNILSHSHSAKYLSFSKLSSIQKDFYDYKKGFSTSNQQAINNLYSDLESDDVIALYNGFGKKISEMAFSDSSTFTIDDFRNRCENIINEFQSICDGIRKTL